MSIFRRFLLKPGERWADKWGAAEGQGEDKRALSDTSKDVIDGIPASVPSDASPVITVSEASWKKLCLLGNIGRTFEIRFDPDEDPVTLPILEFRSDDDTVRELTVTLQKFEPFWPGPSAASPAFEGQAYFARIEWGIGGFNNQADVDFVTGATLNLSASFVRIIAMPVLKYPAATAGIQKFGAFVSPGHRRGGRAPQSTVYLSSVTPVFGDSIVVAGATSFAYAIPNYAYQGFLCVGRHPIGFAAVPPVGEVRFLDHGEFRIADYVFGAAGDNFARVTEPMRFPNNTRLVRFVNNTAVDLRTAIVFDLDL